MALILIVDDGESNRELLSAALRHTGHQVAEATNGQEALDLLRNKQPQLAIVDIQMPGMDGYEVLAQTLADPQIRHIPLIALTAYAMPSDREKGMAAGFREYVTKPVPIRVLIQVLERYLPPEPPTTMRSAE